MLFGFLSCMVCILTESMDLICQTSFSISDSLISTLLIFFAISKTLNDRCKLFLDNADL